MNLNAVRLNNVIKGATITAYDIDGMMYFSGLEVMRLLEYSEASSPLRKYGSGGLVWESEKKKVYVHTIQLQNQSITVHNNMMFITETGLYQMLMSSKSQVALNFQEWVLRDILPFVKRAGGYVNNYTIEDIFGFDMTNEEKVKNGLVAGFLKAKSHLRIINKQ